jgi:hypothetical protein
MPNPSIPSDFFELSSTEVRALQQERKLEAERMNTLRTRKMRAARGVPVAVNIVSEYIIILVIMFLVLGRGRGRKEKDAPFEIGEPWLGE